MYLLHALCCCQDNFEVLTDSLDILTDVVAKFGHLLPEQHATIVQLLQPYLDDSRQGIRKRALHCIGAHRLQQLADWVCI